MSLEQSSDGAVSRWVRTTRELLQLEHGAERCQLQDRLSSLRSKECEAEGLSILHLDVESVRCGLYGRTVVVLERLDKRPLPPSSFKVGDEVRVYSPKLQGTEAAESSSFRGVVCKVTAVALEVVVSSGGEDPGGGIIAKDQSSFPPPLRLDMLANDSTHRKMMSALEELEGMQDSSTWPLANILFNGGDLCEDQARQVSITPLNPGLN